MRVWCPAALERFAITISKSYELDIVAMATSEIPEKPDADVLAGIEDELQRRFVELYGATAAAVVQVVRPLGSPAE